MERIGIEDSALAEKVKNTLLGHDMLACGAAGRKVRVLVAFSGGADSSVLLRVLAALEGQLCISVGAFHLNHGIRGAEADRDERHCAELCAELGIPFASERADVPAYAKEQGMGLEEAARELRYEALTRHCLSAGYDCIATAHHADDVLETVLFRLARGTSLKGLCGIPHIRYAHGCRIIRPLLDCERDEIEAFAEEYGIRYVTDSTNGDIGYSRNRIRNLILPELKKINPRVSGAVSRMTELLSEDERALDALSERLLPDDDASACPTGAVSDVSDAILSRKLAACYRAAAGDGGSGMLEAVHLSALIKLCRGGALWSRLSLPGGVTAVKERTCVRFEKGASAEKTACPGHIRLGPGLTAIPCGGDPFGGGAFYIFAPGSGSENSSAAEGDGQIAEKFKKIAKIKNGSINIYKLSIHESVNSVKLLSSVFSRGRLDGDTVRMRGMHRRTKKLYQEKKLSPGERDRLPVVCDGDGILWIPGVAVRDGIKGAPDSGTEIIYFPREVCAEIPETPDGDA